MQLRIVLFYSFIFTNIGVCRAASSARDERKLRKKVKVSKASMEGDILTPLNARSSSVPDFSAHDHQFTTVYKMTCGSKVTAIMGAKGNARCMPESNDIVVVVNDDEVLVEDCLKIIVCTPSTEDNNVLCQPDTIKVLLPNTDLMLTHSSRKDSPGYKFKVTKGEIVFTNDPRCLLSFEKEQKLRHRFQNKGNKLRNILEDYPGFYLQPTFYSKRRHYRRGNAVTFGGNLHKGTKTLSNIKCNAECDEGQLFYYKMAANVLIYSKIFIDGAACDWVKICVHGKEGVTKKNFACDDVDLVNIYVRNGFVTMPGAPNAAPIRLVKSTLGASITDSLKSRPTQIAFEYDGSRFVVWSVSREVVVSASNMGHDGHIIVYMSDHDCLIKKLGIQDMGENNGVVHQVHVNKPIKGVSTGKKIYVTYETAKARTRPPTLETEKPTPNFSAVAPVTTTRHMGIGIVGSEISGFGLIRGRTGWLIWMIFIGFFCGSFTALFFGIMILYINRRTIYADWYRGIYKRYGVDPADTRGGITGSMFDTVTSAVAPVSTIGATTEAEMFAAKKKSPWESITYSGTYGATSGTSGTSRASSASYGSSRSTKHRSTKPSRSSSSSSKKGGYVTL